MMKQKILYQNVQCAEEKINCVKKLIFLKITPNIIMYQIKNNLSLVYDFNNENHIVSISFNIHEKSLKINCTCSKGCYCHHTDYMVDFIYNYYFHYDEIDPHELKTYNYNNKLWLPVSETDMNENPFVIDVELIYTGGKFHNYCSYCSPGIDTLDNCRHLDYIIKKFAEHYYDLKEQNDEINNINLDELSFSKKESSSMDIEN